MVIYLHLLSDLPLYFHPAAWPIVGVTRGSLGAHRVPPQTYLCLLICYPSAILTGKEQRLEGRPGRPRSPATLLTLQSSFLGVEQCAEWPFRPSDVMQQARSPKFPLLDGLGQGTGESAHRSQRMTTIGNTSYTWPASMGASMGLGPRNQSSHNFRCHLTPLVCQEGCLVK